jgi:hypothetical protein
MNMWSIVLEMNRLTKAEEKYVHIVTARAQLACRTPSPAWVVNAFGGRRRPSSVQHPGRLFADDNLIFGRGIHLFAAHGFRMDGTQPADFI